MIMVFEKNCKLLLSKRNQGCSVVTGHQLALFSNWNSLGYTNYGLVAKIARIRSRKLSLKKTNLVNLNFHAFSIILLLIVRQRFCDTQQTAMTFLQMTITFTVKKKSSVTVHFSCFPDSQSCDHYWIRWQIITTLHIARWRFN